MLDLVVEPSQHTARRPRVIVLHELRIQPGRGKLAAIVAFVEKTALVAENARLDQQHIRYLGRRDLYQEKGLSNERFAQQAQ